MVDAPIAALRAIFGPRVAVVGRCHSEVATRGDFIIEDNYPGIGPLGGILSALEFAREHGQCAVFVLAGDLPNIDPQSLRRVLDAAQSHPDAWAVAGHTCGLEPCIAIYRLGMIEPLTRALAAEASKSASLVHVLRGLATERLAICELSLSVAKNVNTPDELMH
jgi:molybdopterin-guanine dinucleotide biosynthesis protein A